MTPKQRVSGRYTAGIPKRRKPNPDQRRRELCDAAIQLLADDGAKGLSHLKVDGRAGVPDGTTSFYFRTRSALLHAVAERMVELDLATLQAVADSAGHEDGASPSALAKVVIQSGEAPQLSRTRARSQISTTCPLAPSGRWKTVCPTRSSLGSSSRVTGLAALVPCAASSPPNAT